MDDRRELELDQLEMDNNFGRNPRYANGRWLGACFIAIMVAIGAIGLSIWGIFA